MKITEISKSFGFKKNLGNYEMADFFASVKAEVSEDEIMEASQKLQEIVKDAVRKDIQAFKEPKVMKPAGPKSKNPLDYKAVSYDEDGKPLFTPFTGRNVPQGHDTPATIDMVYGNGSE